jgi:hypothetical protein
MTERVLRFLRELPAVVLRVACFSVPALMIALGVAVPALLGVAAVAIVIVNEPGSLYDTAFISDLATIGAGAAFLGLLAFVVFAIAGSSKRLKAGIVAGPALTLGALALFLVLGVAIAIQGAGGDAGLVESRFQAWLRLVLIALAATLTIVLPVIFALRKWADVTVVHPRLSLVVWFTLTAILLGNVGDPPETPEAAVAKAVKKGEALARGSPPPADAADLAWKHRPLLLFDSGEQRSPLDVDEFLAERGGDGEPAHQLCTDTGIAYRSCSGVSGADDLAPAADDPGAVIALDVNPAPRAGDEFRDEATAQRMYFHVDADDPDGRVHLDYWIFYRYNDSPQFSDHTCLSGFSFKDLTCFDHEGDWEGITVSLTRDRRPESVVYVGHHWRYRFAWDDLRALRVVGGSRPRVWVARGSHASYPAECGKRVKRSCRQPASDVPDGARDGRKGWRRNSDSACRAVDCLRPLPLTEAGKPSSWAAFPGYWGAARCTVGTRLCTRSLGPDTPAFQGRYADPGGKGAARTLLRQWYGRAVDRLPSSGGA